MLKEEGGFTILVEYLNNSLAKSFTVFIFAMADVLFFPPSWLSLVRAMRSNIYDTGLVFKLQCTVCENNII
jgi:hypothetical protein